MAKRGDGLDWEAVRLRSAAAWGRDCEAEERLHPFDYGKLVSVGTPCSVRNLIVPLGDMPSADRHDSAMLRERFSADCVLESFA